MATATTATARAINASTTRFGRRSRSAGSKPSSTDEAGFVRRRVRVGRHLEREATEHGRRGVVERDGGDGQAHRPLRVLQLLAQRDRRRVRGLQRIDQLGGRVGNDGTDRIGHGRHIDPSLMGRASVGFGQLGSAEPRTGDGVEADAADDHARSMVGGQLAAQLDAPLQGLLRGGHQPGPGVGGGRLACSAGVCRRIVFGWAVVHGVLEDCGVPGEVPDDRTEDLLAQRFVGVDEAEAVLVEHGPTGRAPVEGRRLDGGGLLELERLVGPGKRAPHRDRVSDVEFADRR